MYHSCEKYYKPITVQCFIADLVPGLCQTHEDALRTELICVWGLAIL